MGQDLKKLKGIKTKPRENVIRKPSNRISIPPPRKTKYSTKAKKKKTFCAWKACSRDTTWLIQMEKKEHSDKMMLLICFFSKKQRTVEWFGCCNLVGSDTFAVVSWLVCKACGTWLNPFFTYTGKPRGTWTSEEEIYLLVVNCTFCLPLWVHSRLARTQSF